MGEAECGRWSEGVRRRRGEGGGVSGRVIGGVRGDIPGSAPCGLFYSSTSLFIYQSNWLGSMWTLLLFYKPTLLPVHLARLHVDFSIILLVYSSTSILFYDHKNLLLVYSSTSIRFY